MFLANWVADFRSASAEERATMCELIITVGDRNSCSHWNYRANAQFESVTVPTVYLAEGIAADWWRILGGRDQEFPISKYRTGYILPRLTFSCDGSVFQVTGQEAFYENPGLRFQYPGSQDLPRTEAEKELSKFVEDTIEKLSQKGITDSEVAFQWSRVSESRQDPEESSFCEAAGALGVDPYSIDEADATFIMEAGLIFRGEPLSDFLAGVKDTTRNQRKETLSSVKQAIDSTGAGSCLPDLAHASKVVDPSLRGRRPGEGAWAPGYRSARAFRNAIGVSDRGPLTSLSMVSDKLGNKAFEFARGLSGVDALVSRQDNIHIHLQNTTHVIGYEWTNNFNFARGVGDVVCFPESEPSVLNGLPGTERQAMGRAFAAEFLAPVDTVLDLSKRGKSDYEIATALNVSPRVVGHQIENRDRIHQACV